MCEKKNTEWKKDNIRLTSQEKNCTRTTNLKTKVSKQAKYQNVLRHFFTSLYPKINKLGSADNRTSEWWRDEDDEEHKKWITKRWWWRWNLFSERLLKHIFKLWLLLNSPNSEDLTSPPHL